MINIMAISTAEMPAALRTGRRTGIDDTLAGGDVPPGLQVAIRDRCAAVR